MIERKGDLETVHEVFEEALEHTFLMPDEQDGLRERLGHALLLETLQTIHMLDTALPDEEKRRGWGYYIGLASLPLCLVSYALFFYFGAWALPGFLIPGAAVIVGMVIDEKEQV